MPPRSVLSLLVPLALLAAADAPPVASAFHHPELPLLASGGGSGTGWASFAVSTDGSRVAIDAMAFGTSGSAQTAIFLFDASGRFLWGVQFTIVHPASDGALVHASPLGDPTIHLDTRTRADPSGRFLGMGIDITGAGTYKVLTWASGKAASWSWSASGAGGTQMVGGRDSGSAAFLHEAGDFRGVANAQVARSGASGRVMLEATKVLHVQDKLYGMFLDVNFKGACAVACVGPPAPTILSATGPLGDTRDCTALRNSVCRWVGNAPGTYTFRATGPDAGMAGERSACLPDPAAVCAYEQLDADHILLGGADARLV